MSSISATGSVGGPHPNAQQQPVRPQREADHGRDEATESTSTKGSESAPAHSVDLKA